MAEEGHAYLVEHSGQVNALHGEERCKNAKDWDWVPVPDYQHDYSE